MDFKRELKIEFEIWRKEKIFLFIKSKRMNLSPSLIEKSSNAYNVNFNNGNSSNNDTSNSNYVLCSETQR